MNRWLRHILCSSHSHIYLGGILISLDSKVTASVPSKKKRKKAKQRKFILSACVIILCLLFFLILSLLLIPTKSDDPQQTTPPIIDVPLFKPTPKIPSGTTISGIDVGGLTVEKAKEALDAVVSHQPETQNMVLTYGGKQLKLSPENTESHWDIEKAVNSAIHGDQTNYDLEMAVNKTAIREQITKFFQSFGGIYSPSGFWMEGKKPNIELEEETSQTLVLSPGSKGLPINLEDILDEIITAYKKDTYHVTIPDAGDIKEPQHLDLEEIYRQVTIAPVNPDLNRKTLEIIPGKKGYGFSIEEAEKLLEKSKSGNVKVNMIYLDPQLSVEDVWFQDVLGCCFTEHNDNENRNENLRLACEKLNGIILHPGEMLSYNQTLGQRTSEAGYKPAPAYSGVELVNEIGGGICQVSSTLYLSSLFSELTIVERKNHGFPANYIPLGLDATVNWGTTDLKIRNDYELPVKIIAEVTDEYVKVKIMGVEQRDYYVKMEFRVDDHPSYASAYRCRYDNETDEEIYRVLDHTSSYLEEVWCWPGYIQSAVDETQ